MITETKFTEFIFIKIGNAKIHSSNFQNFSRGY